MHSSPSLPAEIGSLSLLRNHFIAFQSFSPRKFSLQLSKLNIDHLLIRTLCLELIRGKDFYSIDFHKLKFIPLSLSVVPLGRLFTNIHLIHISPEKSNKTQWRNILRDKVFQWEHLAKICIPTGGCQDLLSSNRTVRAGTDLCPSPSRLLTATAAREIFLLQLKANYICNLANIKLIVATCWDLYCSASLIQALPLILYMVSLQLKWLLQLTLKVST